jgi:hypothetical protein
MNWPAHGTEMSVLGEAKRFTHGQKILQMPQFDRSAARGIDRRGCATSVWPEGDRPWIRK